METANVGMSERKREIRRRRKRHKKLGLLAKRLGKATVSEKAVIAGKIRALTPGCDVVLSNLGLVDR